MESSPAVLLRRIRLTETSLIVTWLTRDHGRIKTVAKGALRPKSAFRGVLDLFHVCEIQVVASRSSDLHSLREATLLQAHEAIGQDHRKTRMASYFAELIELVTELEHPAPEIFDLLRRALGYLEKSPPTRRALSHFEAETVRLLGLAPVPTPAQAIGQLTGRLPRDRQPLWDSLPIER